MSELSAVPLPAPAPRIDPEVRPYWDGAAAGRLVLPRCDDCGHVIWYPRPLCPSCGSTAVSWFEASGRGRVYSYTVNSRGEGVWREASPYVLAYVELDEGPRVLTNLVDVAIDAVAVDLAVTAVFVDTGEGTALLRFRPA